MRQRRRHARENPEMIYWVLGLGVAALAVGGIAYFATRPKAGQLPTGGGGGTTAPGGRTLSDMTGGSLTDDAGLTITPPGSAATARGGFTPLREFSWGGPATDFPEAGT